MLEKKGDVFKSYLGERGVYVFSETGKHGHKENCTGIWATGKYLHLTCTEPAENLQDTQGQIKKAGQQAPPSVGMSNIESVVIYLKAISWS